MCVSTAAQRMNDQLRQHHYKAQPPPLAVNGQVRKVHELLSCEMCAYLAIAIDIATLFRIHMLHTLFIGGISIFRVTAGWLAY